MLRTKIKERNKQTKKKQETSWFFILLLLLKEKEIRFDLEHHIAMTL